MQVQQYDETCDTLFQDYMEKAIKGKVYASEPPENFEEFARDYQEAFGFDFDASEIQPNASMRALYKLIANSLWGKFGQRPITSNTEMFNDTHKLWQRVIDPKTVVSTAYSIPGIQDAVVIRFSRKNSENDPPKHINTAIAAFTTAYARTHLYREGFQKLHADQILYCDTDSIIYVRDRNNPQLTCIDTSRGHLLGQFKDEFDGLDYAIEFYAVAPKSYGYCTQAGKTEVKSKGFTLDSEAINTVNLQAYRKMVRGLQDTISVTYDSRIERDRFTQLPVVVSQNKTMRTFYTKRRILPHQGDDAPIRTVPWGYSV